MAGFLAVTTVGLLAVTILFVFMRETKVAKPSAVIDRASVATG